MSERHPRPGVSRSERISDQGLDRLEKQLASGVRVARPVLDQWVTRYGDAAKAIIERYGMRLDE